MLSAVLFLRVHSNFVRICVLYFSGTPLSQEQYFCDFSRILKCLWSAVLYFSEQIMNKSKSGTDRSITRLITPHWGGDAPDGRPILCGGVPDWPQESRRRLLRRLSLPLDRKKELLLLFSLMLHYLLCVLPHFAVVFTTGIHSPAYSASEIPVPCRNLNTQSGVVIAVSGGVGLTLLYPCLLDVGGVPQRRP